MASGEATGNAILQHVYPLFEATPSGLYELIQSGVDRADQLRRNAANTKSRGSAGLLPVASPLAMLNLA